MAIRILAVEDSATQAEHLRALLAEAGFDVTLARSGEAALERLEENTFDLVLTDVVMPGISGYDLCENVKRDWPDTPVILLTSLTDPMDIVRGLEAGGDNYITKPYEPDHLLARVRRVLDNRSLRQNVRTSMGVTINFLGNAFTITSEKEQILDLLLSSVEDTVRANLELEARQRELTDAHARLEMYATEQAREARRSNERYRALMQNAGDAIFVLDQGGIVVEANNRAGELLGRPLEQVIFRPLDDFMDADIAEVLQALGSEEGGSGRPENRRMFGANGEEAWVELSTSVTRLDDEPFVLAIARDVTERRRSEEQLRSMVAALEESEEKLRAVFSASPVGIILLDLDGNVQIWGGAAERIFGWSAQEVLGRPLPITVREETLGESQRLRDLVLRGGSLSDVEIQRARKDGTPVDLSLSASPLRDAGGEVDGILATLTDITERKQNEDALRQRDEELRHSQRLDAIGRLSGGIAHDFNNVLTAIQGSTQLLLMELPDDSPIREDLMDIEHAAARATGLTRQLLAFSRKQVAQPMVLDLNDEIHEIERMLRRLLGENVELRLDLTSDPARVRADPAQVHQVIMNLAVNARDAMTDGGILSMETTTTEDDPLLAGPAVRVTVRDTGEGIPEDVREKIFEPFFTTKGSEGTGLGLSTVYGIVKQSGGTIEVEAPTQGGTAFHILLPRVDQVPEVAEQSTVPAGPLGGSETILVVEDEDAVRKLAARILRKHGYTVLDAPTGEKALEALHAHPEPIDLMVTDLMMPGMGGAELADRVEEAQPGTPVLFMSGYTDETIVEQGILKPGVWLLEKPFTPDAFVRRVRRVIAHGSR